MYIPSAVHQNMRTSDTSLVLISEHQSVSTRCYELIRMYWCALSMLWILLFNDSS